MKWSRVNPTCIRSGAYRISRYTLGGMDYYEIYHGDELIGDARDSNKAREVAEAHKSKESSKTAIGGSA